MKINDNTILITGGATGIGFALAEAFVKEGNEVIICGRREHTLKEAKSKLPQIHTRLCDLTKEKEREALYDWIKSDFKDINVLVNNAGIQRMIDFQKGISNLTISAMAVFTHFPHYKPGIQRPPSQILRGSRHELTAL